MLRGMLLYVENLCHNYFLQSNENHKQSNILCHMKYVDEVSQITYLFPLEFFYKTFAIFQVRRIRSMAVPEIMVLSFCWKSAVRSFLNLLLPVMHVT